MAARRRPDPLLLTSAGTPSGAGFQPAAASEQAGSLSHSSGAWNGDSEDLVLSSLGKVLRHYQFQLDPLFAGVKPAEPEAAALLQLSRLDGRVPGAATINSG